MSDESTAVTKTKSGERLEAARCAQAFLADYTGPERDQIPFQLLEAVARLTSGQLQAGVAPKNVRFTPMELVQEALQVGLKRKPPANEASPWLNKHWKRLERLLEQVQEKLASTAREQGFSYLPALAKEQSPGGRRHRSYYWLEART